MWQLCAKPPPSQEVHCVPCHGVSTEMCCTQMEALARSLPCLDPNQSSSMTNFWVRTQHLINAAQVQAE